MAQSMFSPQEPSLLVKASMHIHALTLSFVTLGQGMSQKIHGLPLCGQGIFEQAVALSVVI